MEIQNFEQFIKPILKNGDKFVSYECNRLLPPGENYGSIMLEVKINIRNKNGEQETINCVAKSCPPPGFLWEMFNTKVTFKKEIELYNTIIPILNDFGREHGIDQLVDFVADSKCARISLDPNSTEVDENAILLLENLKLEGYTTGDRFIGFDLESTEILLRDLATMHASVIALKLAKPEVFEKKILPYLGKHFLQEFPEDIQKESVNKILTAYKTMPECVPYLPKVEDILVDMFVNINNPPKTNEIFTTLTHNDFWVNNTMLKYVNGKPVSNKIVDFQIIEHSSLANDLVFFLYSSVELSILENNLDNLLKYYYNCFISTLTKLGGDVSPYSYEALLEEFIHVGKSVQWTHVAYMLLPLMTLKGKVKDLADLELNDILVDEASLHDNYYKKLKFILLDFIKRGWF
ncbi:hypothetical protein MML48_5g00005484 [Holotrichia oblita]|uniref:Uncharacterized protein n=1 Tax=Holotrichia oblita TaxID=644536 RepID=A0ACB9T4Y4_HOLOL|nr:hypothetical protein MML48_5g00005484 [Holotrichia oblita]